MKNKKTVSWLAIILAVILVCSFIQHSVLTNGGKTRVEDVSWVTDDGAYLTSRIFIPAGVDAAHPAPAVVCAHGWNNTLEVQEVNCIELAKRGYVVLSCDAYGHGNSTQTVGLMTNDDLADCVENDAVNQDFEGDAAVQDGGVYSGLQYVGSLPFVDSERIGLVGHSMGGYTIQAAAFRALANHEKDPGVIIPHAIFIMCEGADYDYSAFQLNIATITPQFDEFGTGHWGVTEPRLANTSPKLKNFFGFSEDSPDIVYGQFYSYGELGALSEEQAIATAKEGKLRVAYFLEGRTHAGTHNSFVAEDDILNYFRVTLKGIGTEVIPTDSQSWLTKNIAGLISLVMFFLLMIPVTLLLMQTKFFGALAKEPYHGTVLQDSKSRCIYIVMLLVGMIPPFALFYPLMGAPIGVKFMNFVTQIPFKNSTIFPMQIMNGYSLFNLVIGIIVLVLFAISFSLLYKKNGGKFSDYGLKISLKDFLKACLLATLVFLISYSVLVIMNYFFDIDFRFFTLSMKTITPLKWGLYLRYVLFFAVFYVANSIMVNISVSLDGKKEWVNILLGAVSSVGGLLVLHLVAYCSFYATGFLGMSSYCSFGNNSAMAAILVWGLLLILPLTSIMSRVIYKRTGNVWICGLVNTLAVTFFAISNTAITNGVFY